MNWLQKIAQPADRDQYMEYEHRPVSDYPVGGAGGQGDWISAVSQEFLAHPHPEAGKFVQWTKPNLGQVSFMNKAKTVRVELRMDAQFVGDAAMLIYVSTRNDKIGSKRLSRRLTLGRATPQDDLNDYAKEIVAGVYELIDRYIAFSTDMGLDADWKTAQTEDDFLYPESTHDYEITWDHEPDEALEDHYRKLIERIVQELNAELIPKLRIFKTFRVEPVNSLYHKNLAEYISGTYSSPVIAIDIGNLVAACEEYEHNCGIAIEMTIVHELAHAIQEAKGLDFDEDEAEMFATAWHYGKQIHPI